MTRQQEQLRTQRLTILADAIDGGRDCLNEAALERALIEIKKPYSGLTLKPLYRVVDDTPAPMHCEHIVAYYASRRKLKGVRFDAYEKMHREYRRAARNADYAATFWRA